MPWYKLTHTASHRRMFDYARVPRRRRDQILVCMLLWSIAAYLLISHFLLRSAQVVGESMLPTLYPGERTIMNRWAYRTSAPARGDIVAVQLPWDSDLSVKRIVALPFEWVRIKDGKVYVNRLPLSEPYLPTGTSTLPGTLSDHTYEVEADSYFVMGDNRNASTDSRSFGAVHREWIVGRLRAAGPADKG